jgi:hypothetical protein
MCSSPPLQTTVAMARNAVAVVVAVEGAAVGAATLPLQSPGAAVATATDARKESMRRPRQSTLPTRRLPQSATAMRVIAVAQAAAPG